MVIARVRLWVITSLRDLRGLNQPQLPLRGCGLYPGFGSSRWGFVSNLGTTQYRDAKGQILMML